MSDDEESYDSEAGTDEGIADEGEDTFDANEELTETDEGEDTFDANEELTETDEGEDTFDANEELTETDETEQSDETELLVEEDGEDEEEDGEKEKDGEEEDGEDEELGEEKDEEEDDGEEEENGEEEELGEDEEEVEDGEEVEDEEEEDSIEVSPEVKAEINEKSEYSQEVNDHIRSVEELEVYQKAGLKEATVDGRTCLIRSDIDYDYLDEESGMTNRELMAAGRAPFDAKTGEQIELHHIGQQYDSPLAELTADSEHGDGNQSLLHSTKSDSWREDSKKNNHYNNVQRPSHWIARA